MTMGVFVQLNEESRMADALPIGYVVTESGCWDWVGTRNRQGYGILWRAVGTRRAHRWVYEMHRGPIPAGLVLDHLCRNPGCVNPDHLEVVTYSENMLRGISPTAKTSTTGICKRGHRLSFTPSGKRRCFECDRAYKQRWEQARREDGIKRIRKGVGS